jgi:hypothetical protein
MARLAADEIVILPLMKKMIFTTEHTESTEIDKQSDLAGFEIGIVKVTLTRCLYFQLKNMVKPARS